MWLVIELRGQQLSLRQCVRNDSSQALCISPATHQVTTSLYFTNPEMKQKAGKV